MRAGLAGSRSRYWIGAGRAMPDAAADVDQPRSVRQRAGQAQQQLAGLPSRVLPEAGRCGWPGTFSSGGRSSDATPLLGGDSDLIGDGDRAQALLPARAHDVAGWRGAVGTGRRSRAAATDAPCSDPSPRQRQVTGLYRSADDTLGPVTIAGSSTSPSRRRRLAFTPSQEAPRQSPDGRAGRGRVADWRCR